ncbi:MAG TPA: GDSL-type esterase/lipase family protein [Beijerinckiaceae bacterium]|jgi:lysophospholipase L1-like esterase|nr:GDSL-type esterase/lipase family protein [Beijerinckiaceae bacterium]
MFLAAVLFTGTAQAQSTPVDNSQAPATQSSATNDPAAAIDAAVPTPAPPDPNNAVVQYALSSQCSVPSKEIASPAPLSAMVSKLEAGKGLRILAIGSSSTWGIGASTRQKNYPSQLETMLEKSMRGVDIEVVNRGVSGETSETTADRLKTEAVLIKPDVVLWQLGTNDAIQHVPVDTFELNVRKTIKALRRKGIDVVLVGLQYTPNYSRDAHYFAIRDALNRIAADLNVLYVKRYSAMEFIARTKANMKMLADDGFHLNDMGYQCMAEHIANAVTANLFVRRRKPAS